MRLLILQKILKNSFHLVKFDLQTPSLERDFSILILKRVLLCLHAADRYQRNKQITSRLSKQFKQIWGRVFEPLFEVPSVRLSLYCKLKRTFDKGKVGCTMFRLGEKGRRFWKVSLEKWNVTRKQGSSVKRIRNKIPSPPAPPPLPPSNVYLC